MKQWQKSIPIFLSFLLLSGWCPAPLRGFPLPIQALLMQVAATQPEQTVSVIVQTTTNQNGVATKVGLLGGRVTQDLPIIHAFAAELKAKDVTRLAQVAGIRWISLNAGMKQTQAASSITLTTWATAIGSSLTNNFTQASAMVSSAVGPDNRFGSGSNVQGAFGGFDNEATPGFAITKVEVILHAYIQSPLKAGQDPKLSVVAGGQRSAAITLSHHAFDTYIGASLAGPAIVDITKLRTWQWADFENNLEVVLDQSKFASDQFIYYDAIGLRVTSLPGVDNSAATTLTAWPKGAIDPTKLLNVYNATVRATDVWNEAPGYLQGQGLSIAVVDSGLGKNKDWEKRVSAKVNFNQAYHNSTDQYGHGTFVAGIAAGNGQASQGRYLGIAPKTNLVNVRVSDDEGMATEADVVTALQWVLQNKSKYNIRVVNLSLNSSVFQSYHTSPLDAAAEILWFNGIVVVVAAGNNGTANLYPPANDPFVITVGATDDQGTTTLADDTVAPFSAYGTTEVGAIKPELVAPGTKIKGYLPSSNQLTIGQLHRTNMLAPDFFWMSGTSMAAPIVSGGVALLLQAEPSLTPDQVKYRLMATANQRWVGYAPVRAGAGLLDIYAAVHGATVQSANTGLAVSNLLTTGPNGVLAATVNWSSVNWSSVNWSSVNWSSVNWSSVNWSSVNWSSVNWSSDYWENEITAASIDTSQLNVTENLPVTTNNDGAVDPTRLQSNQIFLPVIVVGH